MPVSTRRTPRPESQEGQGDQQDDGMGVGPTQGPTGSSSGTVQSEEVDVRQPMSLRQMQEMVDSQPLSTEQLRILNDRIRELV